VGVGTGTMGFADCEDLIVREEIKHVHVEY